ncbi:MAG TPA: restriction endonuclease [Blastocatellia bacterium]|nr:restriction endonuclease [Blastocatellia bacterium]HMZ19878.1 restriction endonuclease [Blastocatellia bacterium]
MTAYDAIEITADGYTLYDVEPDDGIASVRCVRYPLLLNLRKCTYCSAEIIRAQDREYQDDGDHLVRDYCLWYCRNCRFWQFRHYYEPSPGQCFPGAENVAFISKLREFDDKLPECCDAELVSYIRRNPSFFHSCTPKNLEKLIVDIFRANFTNAEVIHVGKPDDGGVDIMFIDTEGQHWLIQAKRRESSKKAEGVSTIRSLLGAMILEGALKGIVVSTANQFSLRARQASDKASQLGLTVKLIDKGILNRMLDPILPDRPWLLPLSQVDKELAQRLGTQIHSDNQLSLFSTQRFKL